MLEQEDKIKNQKKHGGNIVNNACIEELVNLIKTHSEIKYWIVDKNTNKLVIVFKDEIGVYDIDIYNKFLNGLTECNNVFDKEVEIQYDNGEYKTIFIKLKTSDFDITEMEYGGGVKDITCKSCNWSWNKSDSEKHDEYVCHKCGADNKMKDGGELGKGIKAEQEHKGTLEKLYQRKITPSQGPKYIAKEHLKEDENYYTKLKRAKLKTGGLAIVNWFRSKPKVSDDVLYNWAKQKLDINLLNWTGFDNKNQFEEQMGQPFVLDDFIKDFRADLEETYIRRNKANMIEMGKRGGAMNDNWVSKEDERMGFSVHGLTRTANPSVMLHTLFDVVPTLERGLKTAENMYKVDPKLGRVEVQGKATRKLYYIITLSEDGTYDIKSSQNETLNSLQFSNVADIESPISDNRAYIRAKLFGETDNYKEPEDLKIGDIVLIDKVKENGFRGYVKVIEKDGYIYKGVSITHADNPARQDYQVKNSTQKFSVGNVTDKVSIQDEENLKNYKIRIKNQ